MTRSGFPDGSVVLHIGPHKTGTTTMQAALWANREDIRAQGVLYPGNRAHEMDSAMAMALGIVDPGKDLAFHRASWHRLVDGMHADHARLSVLSSEFYCEADAERRAAVLSALGDRVQVVVTLRPLVRLLPSQWQQYCQNKLTIPYVDWLHQMLDDPDASTISPTFWRRHRHDRLVRRWAASAGAENVTVLIADERDHRSLPTMFEGLLSLTPGSLTPPAARLNRSLTFDEVTLMLEFNRLYRDADWDQADYNRFVRFGAARGMQAITPRAGDQSVLTPRWAVDRALGLGAAMADDIASVGVRVIGSLDQLSDPGLAPAVGDNDPVDDIAPDALAGFAAGAIDRLDRVAPTQRPRQAAGPIEKASWAHARAAAVGVTGRRAALRELVRRGGRRLRPIGWPGAHRRGGS